MYDEIACEICHMTNDGTNYKFEGHIICERCKKSLRLLKEETVKKYMNSDIFDSYDDYIDNQLEILSNLKKEFVKKNIYNKHILTLAKKIKQSEK